MIVYDYWSFWIFVQLMALSALVMASASLIYMFIPERVFDKFRRVLRL